MLAQRIIFIGALIFPTVSIAESRPDSCIKETKLEYGFLRSHPYAFGPNANMRCSTYLTRYANNEAQEQYTFLPGGIVHRSDNANKPIHSMAFVAAGEDRDSFVKSGDSYLVRQPGLSWQYSSSSFGLTGIKTEDGRNCLTHERSANVVPISSTEGFDVKACPNVVAMDFGSSGTEQTAPLKRSQAATLKAQIGSELHTCSVKIGRLFEYQEGRSSSKETIIVEKGYDPCYMFASKKPYWAQLPPAQAIARLKAEEPGHQCITVKRGNLEDAHEIYTPIPAGETDLSGFRNLSYRLLNSNDLAHNVAAGSDKKSCAAIAELLRSTSSSAGTWQKANSSGSQR